MFNPDKIRRLLEDRKISQAQFLKDTSISKSNLYVWLNNTSIPGADNLENIADYFNFPNIYLFDNQHFINLPAMQYDHIAPTDRKHLSPAFTEDRHELVTFFETLLIKAARTAVITVKAYRLTVLRHHDV